MYGVDFKIIKYQLNIIQYDFWKSVQYPDYTMLRKDTAAWNILFDILNIMEKSDGK